MAQQGLPGLFVDVSATADPTQNARRVSTWSQSVSPLMFGVGGTIVGTLPVPPVPQNCYLEQAGTRDIAFSSGVGTLTYPNPFPNGVLSVIYTPATNGVAGPSLLAGGPAVLTGIELFLTINGSAYTGNAIVSFIAIGW